MRNLSLRGGFMKKWKNIPLFKKEEDRVTGEDDEVSGQKVLYGLLQEKYGLIMTLI